MPIQFLPRPGTVLLCDYTTGFVPPEMTKRRPVVVLSPGPQTLLVVPLSTSEPTPRELHHVQILAGHYRFLDRRVDSWVKGDMISAVSLKRLSPLSSSACLSAHHFLAVQRAVLHALGFAQLTALV
jgi:mRNA interferase MazF